MGEAAAQRIQVVINTESVQEILHRYASLQRWADGLAIVHQLLQAVPLLLPVTPQDVQTLLSLYQQPHLRGMPTRDLLHLAVMQNHGITDIISTDTHFDRVPGITRLDPQALFQQAQQASP